LKLGSFTRASEVVGYTQSGLTHLMDSLEKEIGFDVLERDHNGIKLTEKGQRT
jgi:DNA-binding transcriptional LysR family regulator